MTEHEHGFLVRREIARERWLWRFFLCLPVLYLLLCVAINNLYFLPNHISGFIVLKKSVLKIIFYFACAFATAAACAIIVIKGVFSAKIDSAKPDEKKIITLLRTRLIVLASLCDTTSAMGVILFLLGGDLRHMMIFGIFALVLYAQICPREIEI